MTQLQEVSVDQFKHLVSERALTGETMLLNMGPQHPSTHGVLRLLLELDGETVVNCIPDIGYLHTGIEKNMEAKTFQKAEVMTDRLDYMNPMGNNLSYVMAVEKLVGSLSMVPGVSPTVENRSASRERTACTNSIGNRFVQTRVS